MLAPFPARWARFGETLSSPALMPGSRSRMPRNLPACPRVTPTLGKPTRLYRFEEVATPGVARFEAGGRAATLMKLRCLWSLPVKRGKAVDVPTYFYLMGPATVGECRLWRCLSRYWQAANATRTRACPSSANRERRARGA